MMLYRSKLLLIGLLTVSVSIGTIALIEFRDDSGRQPTQDGGSEEGYGNSSASIDDFTPRIEQTSPSPTGEDPSRDRIDRAADFSRSASDWTSEFHGSSNLWQFVEAAAPAAASGDARAQFLLAEALGECRASVAPYRGRYDDGMTPEQIFEDVFWETASPSLPAAYVEFSRREFMKCAEFFRGDPPALDRLELGTEAHTREYWLSLALGNNDPVALMQNAYLRAARLDDVPEASRRKTIEDIEQAISVAVESADPSALHRLSGLIGAIGSTDPTEGAAWLLVACQSGFDCSYANPAIGRDCIPLGLCSGGESLTLNMQRDLGPLYGEAYARSQQIMLALESGEAEAIVESLLARLQLAE